MSLFQCKACRLVWLDPLPDAEGVKSMYDDAYSGATVGYFSKVPQKLARSRGRVRALVGFLQGGGAGKAFLDVGANGGFMAEAAREVGFEAVGIEPDPASVVYARAHYPGITVVQGLLEDADLGAQRFDVAYCSEVIEHSTDCNKFADKLASVLRPGGFLYLTTPDISHWRRPRDLGRWDGFTPPAHCLYFNPRNLSMLLGRHGFDVVRRRFAWKPGIKIIARRRAN
jgi:2-polyprenyl-3-methyl-5-hydroxy-6-metoxy-1,4-benzoquinol methylase